MDANTDHAANHEEGALHIHVVSPKMLLGVWGTLLFLTVITVAVTEVELGALALTVAIIIAAVKATVVALFFMHLRWERPFLGVIFLIAIAFVLLFLVFAIMDTQIYEPDRIPNWNEQKLN